MQNKFLLIETWLVIVSVILLVMSLVPVRKIIQQLPVGNVRCRWKSLCFLIITFIAGYILYALLHGPESIPSVCDLVVPGIFFGGAVFVYMVCSLSLRTALDLQQMYTLEQETITDSLMGIYNRRYLDRRLTEEFQRARRYEQPFSIFLLDIDYFKKINDTYGHQMGDVVLKKLGAVIVGSVRELDVVIRYGGEEILVILPNTIVANAVDMAQRLRQKIAGTVMVAVDPDKGQPTIQVTVSIGVAGYRFNSGWDAARRVVERADKALYRAKAQGRNRVVSSEDYDELDSSLIGQRHFRS
jgi:diguanylate cyclase (GGDEF)-like protein